MAVASWPFEGSLGHTHHQDQARSHSASYAADTHTRMNTISFLPLAISSNMVMLSPLNYLTLTRDGAGILSVL